MAKAKRTAAAKKAAPEDDSSPKYPELPDGKTGASFTEQSYTSQDGLRLIFSDYGPRQSELTPVICLAGLTRNGRDFHELASWLATIPGHERRVIVPDYRGRGRSEYDRNWENYSLAVELQDILDLLTTLDIEHAIFVGTSRGGLITMLMGAARPAAISGVVLNDIGPVIEPQGLLRIRQYMRERPAARGWDEAADALKRMWAALYPELPDEAWLGLAHKIYRETNGRIVPDYDPNLLKPLEGLDLDKAGPPLWGPFASLTPAPMLCLRGEHSDILTAKTVNEMRRNHPDFDSATVPASGHAPLLIELPVLRLIAGFVANCG
ncbi:MAG: alpha/beta hydrolase [Rhodobiaceae bacterium]|nr:alpha/beta hydrolase [Rhodobiaceae bacterium]MCC0048734.1 alpha/beta hydrolase [Rhodobiaceae bacterium]